jgi:hypothetical protein
MSEWKEEKEYCLAVNMYEASPNLFRFSCYDERDVTYIQFYEDRWEFWCSGILVCDSNQADLITVLENSSAIGATCPICGNGSMPDQEGDGCVAFYYPGNNVTTFWNCDSYGGESHHLAVHGYRLDERYQIKQLRDMLNMGTVKGQFSNIDQIREQLKELNYEFMEEESKESRFEMWKKIPKGGWPGPPPDPDYYAYIDRARLLVFIGHDAFVKEDYMFFPKEIL